MIEFTDADGVKQTLETSKPFNVAYHVDCMELLRYLPDKCFDLAVVDPPYGAGFTEGGGCQGWFSKYHQGEDSSQIVQVERERETAGSDSTEVRRTRTTDGRGTARISFGAN